MSSSVPSNGKPASKAQRPFHFNTSAHLLRIGQERAASLGEFLQALHTCSDASIFQHTFRTLHEHHFIREGFSNDFAQWALSACNEPILAERLANVDIREFTSLTAIRERIAVIVETLLKEKPASADRQVSEPFYFCASEVVVMPTPFVASTLTEFIEGLEHVTLHSIHHHFIEARLRLKLTSNDFSMWLEEETGFKEVARSINRIDLYMGTLEDVRRQIVRIVERALN
jgi:Family of unknown function (DUF5752)